MTTLRPTLFLLAIVLAIISVAPAQAADDGTFEATWSLEGTRESVVLGGKSVAAYRLTGPVKIRTGEGMAREFSTVCTGVSNEETGGMARCTWTDDEGGEIFLELTGKIIGTMGTSRETQGKIAGGTGRYEGLEGWIDTDWLFWESALEEKTVKARDTDTRGGWRRP